MQSQKRGKSGQLVDPRPQTIDGEAKIVIISGTITGNEVIRVGSNTSVLGAAGSCTLSLCASEPHCLYLLFSQRSRVSACASTRRTT